MNVLASLLLPDDVFQSTWFHALATFVAFNTLFYAGLSILKIIPRSKR